MDVYLQIADAIKKDIGKILGDALSGRDKKYRTSEGYVRWGLVESDMHKSVDHHLTSDGEEVDQFLGIRY